MSATVHQTYRPRVLSPAVQTKLDRALAIKAKRDGLRKVQEAAARIQIELERRLELARRAGGADEGWLLREVRLLRIDLDHMEV